MPGYDEMLGLVGRIYEAALEPALWPRTLEALGDLLGKSSVLVTLATMGGHDAGSVWQARLAEFHELGIDFNDAFAPEHNPFVQRFGQTAVGVSIPRRSIIHDSVYERSQPYQLTMRPQSLYHSAMSVLVRDGGLASIMGVMRPQGMDDFGDDDHAVLNRVIPHVGFALRTHARLAALQAERNAVLDALDRMPMGVILVDRVGCVIHANRQGEKIARAADGLSISTGVLRAASPKETAGLAGLIARAVSTGSGEGLDPGGAMALSRPSMLRPLSVLVAPLRSEALDVGPARPAAIVFVSDPEAEAETPESTLARLYGLTPAEARLAAVLMQGHGLEWAAETLGVTINTVRTHSKGLFDKTGVRRQAELVRLVLSGPAGLRGP